MRHLTILFIIGLLAHPTLFAQSEELSNDKGPDYSRNAIQRSDLNPVNPYRAWNVSLGFGLAHPGTDVRYRNIFGSRLPKNENQYSLSLRATKMFSAGFGLRAEIKHSRVQGVIDSLVQRNRNLNDILASGLGDGYYFTSPVTQAGIHVYWNISNSAFSMNRHLHAKSAGQTMRDRRFSFYLFSGLAMAWYSPSFYDLDDNPVSSLKSTPLQLGATSQVVLPVGFGTKFKLSKMLDLGFEYGINYLMGDNLDGFVYDFPGQKRNDHYSNLDINLTVKLGKKGSAKEHMEWIQPIQTVLDDIEALNQDMNRLKSDVDGDGVSDYFDRDLETAEGSPINPDGTLRDSDNDGIPDDADLEPFSDYQVEVDEFGRALDDDKDGVPNHKDLASNTPEGSVVNFQGIPIQTEGESSIGIGNRLPSIYFEFNASKILTTYHDELLTIAMTIKDFPDVSWEVRGFCDATGNDLINDELASQRIQSVINHLNENYQIDKSSFQPVIIGNKELNSPYDAINRRVDIVPINN